MYKLEYKIRNFLAVALGDAPKQDAVTWQGPVSIARVSASRLAQVIVLILLCSPFVVSAAGDPWYEAVAQADARIQAFEQAVKANDSGAMRRAALELQADPIAVKRFNTNSTDALRTAHNNVTDAIKDRTRELLKQQVAAELKVDPSQITTFEATNPPKPGDPVKVGQDWDITVRVDGSDVHHSMSTQHVHNAYYEAVNGSKPPSASAATDLAHRQALEVTSYQHPEAYGGAPSEGGRIISDPQGSPALRDPNQLGNTIEYKSRLPGNEAQRLEAAGDFVKAQGFRMEQARQAAKQFDRQVAVRVAAMGGEVPEHVKKTMDILRRIGDGDITPTQGQRLLAAMGETIDTAASKSAGLIEAAQKLRPGGIGKVDDVFVANARARLRAKGIDPDAIRPPPDPSLKPGDLKVASRSWAQRALKVLEVAGWAADAYELQDAARAYLRLYEKAMDPNTSDEEAARLFAQMEAAAGRIVLLGGLGALFEAYPPAAAVFGVYTITRLGLENTETGKVIDAAALGFIDRHVKAAEKAYCDMAEFVGIENTCAKLDDLKRDRLLAYLRAIRDGKIELQKPFTAKDLGDFILSDVSLEGVIIRVDEVERLAKANALYAAALNELMALEKTCQPLAEKRAEITRYLAETQAIANTAESEMGDSAWPEATALAEARAACKGAAATLASVVAAADATISRAETAAQAHQGALAKLHSCSSETDLLDARQLTAMGIGVAGGAATKYLVAMEGYARLETLSSVVDNARAALAQAESRKDLLKVRKKTLKNRLDVLKSLAAQISSLEKTCSAGVKPLTTRVAPLQRILPDEVAAFTQRTATLQALSSTPMKVDIGSVEGSVSLLGTEGNIEKLLAEDRAMLASCSAIELPVVRVMAMNAAVSGIPDIDGWQAEVAQLSAQCLLTLEERESAKEDGEDTEGDGDEGDEGDEGDAEDTSGDEGDADEEEEEGEEDSEDEGDAGDEDDRDDYEFGEDEGNVSEERVAEGGDGTEAVLGAGTQGVDGEDQSGPQAGDPIDPSYTDDPIAAAERERKRAETAEQIAAESRQGGAHGGKGRDGGIEDEFADPPDPDDVVPGRAPHEGGEPGGKHPEKGEQSPGKNGGGESQETGKGEGEAPAPVKPGGWYAFCLGGEALVRQALRPIPGGHAYGSQAAAAAAASKLDCATKSEEKETEKPDEKEPEPEPKPPRPPAPPSPPVQPPSPPATVSQFAGRRTGGYCKGNIGDAAHRWVIDLSQVGADVTGTISFHRCHIEGGGGRASYRVAGTATSAKTLTLKGSRVSARGPLASTAPQSMNFQVKKDGSFSPNYGK